MSERISTLCTRHYYPYVIDKETEGQSSLSAQSHTACWFLTTYLGHSVRSLLVSQLCCGCAAALGGKSTCQDVQNGLHCANGPGWPHLALCCQDLSIEWQTLAHKTTQSSSGFYFMLFFDHRNECCRKTENYREKMWGRKASWSHYPEATQLMLWFLYCQSFLSSLLQSSYHLCM